MNQNGLVRLVRGVNAILVIGLLLYMGRWQSGQMHLTVNQASVGLRWFESIPTHQANRSLKGADKHIAGISYN